MEGQILFTFPPPIDGKFPDNSAASMVLHTGALTFNHIHAAIVLLRDKCIDLDDKNIAELSNELLVEDMEQMLVLFKKYPTRPVFKDWLREKDI